MRHIRTTHKVALHTPQATCFHCVAVLYIDRTDIGQQTIGRHINAFLESGDIGFHHGVTFVHKIFFGKRILVSVRIRVHHKVTVGSTCVGRSPEEIIPGLWISQFGIHPDVASEQTVHFLRNEITVFPFQERNLTVHFRTGKEVDNRLFVLFHKLLELFFVRSLDSQYHLRIGIYVLRIFERGFRIYILYIYNNNVTYQLQRRIIIFRRSIHNPERRFRLRQTGHISIERIM